MDRRDRRQRVERPRHKTGRRQEKMAKKEDQDDGVIIIELEPTEEQLKEFWDIMNGLKANEPF